MNINFNPELAVKAQSLREYLEQLNGKFFTAVFTKKDGTERKMTARLHVKKHLKGGTNKNPNLELYHIVAYDVQAKAYRTINLATVSEIHSQYHIFKV